MLISQILKENKSIKLLQGSENDSVNYIESDSRKLNSGDIFSVYDSFGENAKDYLSEPSLAEDIIILISEKSKYLALTKKFKNVLVSKKDPMQIHGNLASFLLDHPSRKLKIIAITGTNGKTSLTYILYDIFSRENKNSGIIGTIKTKFANRVIQTGFTTPDPSTLHRTFSEMLKEDIEYVFMEASSHGLKLGRMNGVEILGVIFTNITRDHLDFHKTMIDYVKSKFKLFQLLDASKQVDKFAVISSDSSGSNMIMRLLQKAKFTYPILSFGKGKSYSGFLKKLSLTNTEFQFQELSSSYDLNTNLLGNFNFINVSLAIVLSRKLGIDMENIKLSIESLNSVNGRFQIITNAKKNRIGIVDYAHTPDALENILKSIQEIPHSKIICIFGCGGDRDKTKRPIMAKIAAKYSDRVIITSDNPRTEDPEMILDEIEKGFPKRDQDILRISNRKLAIKKGVEILPDNGILLVAGKGHETVQIIGNKKEDFSDVRELQEAFSYDELSRR